MKKILSLTLAALMVVSMVPTAFAAENQDYSLGTAVTVEGAGGEYTVTVPATLEPGQTGTVTAKGYWAAEDTLKVTAPETIEVTNTVTNQKATVNVDFDGIESLGDDLEELTKTASISVDKGNTKFGTWTGTIVYNVELVEPLVVPGDGQISVVIHNGEVNEDDKASVYATCLADEDMTWEQWVASDYNTIGAEIDGTYVRVASNYFIYAGEVTNNAYGGSVGGSVVSATKKIAETNGSFYLADASWYNG